MNPTAPGSSARATDRQVRRCKPSLRQGDAGIGNRLYYLRIAGRTIVKLEQHSGNAANTMNAQQIHFSFSSVGWIRLGHAG